jgi:hypothetical protein
MLDEKKGTCCHKCGHVHVRGTSCPKPFFTGARSCERRVDEEVDDISEYCTSCLREYLLEYEHKIEEAEYRGKKVQLGKPFYTPDGPKKRSVYVKNAQGNVIKVNFGDPNMKIKKSIPARRKSFRARHHCDNPGPRTKANYWSCRQW